MTPFDEFGNRIFSMQGQEGRIDVVQGVTCITPRYTQVEGLQVKNAYEWDMRISTASIPREIVEPHPAAVTSIRPIPTSGCGW